MTSATEIPEQPDSKPLDGGVENPQPVVTATPLLCSQCGGELHPDEGQLFLACPFCGTTVYLDKSQVVFHWYVAPTLKEGDAQAALFRWMSGSQTVKDLDKKARVVSQEFQYFPIWYFKHQGKQGEMVTLQPAAATSVTELANLKLPGGDLRRYESSLDSRSQAPTVPLEAGLEWLRRAKAVDQPLMKETALVHVPVYQFKYAYRGETFTAIVDAASGTVMANLFPAKAEAPYILVGGVTALVYLCLALAPLIGAASGSPEIGIAACVGLGVIAAPILFAWAFMVASKV